eukprot:15080382-Alexandrium_andersonii.AAC.1
MSASLVGSEMCIRDRCACAVLVTDPASLHGKETEVQSAIRPMFLSSATVSYTHLTLPTICSV